MKTVALVTGATGFVGYHLCKWLYENDYHVIANGINGENQPLCHDLHLSPLNHLPFDKMPKIDICFHQAANNDTTESSYEKMYETNVSHSSTLFRKLLQENNCKNFVYASSCSIYGDRPIPFNEIETEPKPLNPYAVSKLEFENFANDFAALNGVKTIGLRYTNVYGPFEDHKGKRASMISQLLSKIEQGENPILFKNGEQMRDWIYVADVVKANVLASKANAQGIYNVGYSIPYSFNSLVRMICEKLNKKVEIQYVDCPFLDKYQSRTSVDISRSRIDLGFMPRWSIREVLPEMIQQKNRS